MLHLWPKWKPITFICTQFRWSKWCQALAYIIFFAQSFDFDNCLEHRSHFLFSAPPHLNVFLFITVLLLLCLSAEHCRTGERRFYRSAHVAFGLLQPLGIKYLESMSEIRCYCVRYCNKAICYQCALIDCVVAYNFSLHTMSYDKNN